jgi:flagellar biosynthetic protein FliP
MTGAMMAGMFLLAALPDLSSSRNPELYGTLMAVSMTVPMVAWMRFRRHSWRLSSEMAAAMIVPTLVLLVLASLNLVSGRTMIGLQHGLMMPSMLGAMLYRRSEYGL